MVSRNNANIGSEKQSDDGEPFDEKMKCPTTELSGLFALSCESEAEIKENLKAIGREMK